MNNTAVFWLLGGIALILVGVLVLKRRKTDHRPSFRELFRASVSQMGEIEDKNVEDVCACIYWGEMSTFGVTGNKFSPSLGENQEYCSDLALFELGCMLLSRADVWLYGNATDIERHKVGFVLKKKLMVLFSIALDLRPAEVTGLVDSRLDYYGKLVREGAELSTIHLHLRQWIFCSVDKQKPVASVEAFFGSTFIDSALKGALIDFEQRTMVRMNEHLQDWLEVL